ncbi:transcriptional regulator, LacI family [Loktanella atrilutea]|uniref:Transcriptional regulator, LacI family n=1 Tax=Loktanella atrilutea TaxID=366533 RepID=A0A1M5CMW7_LOKAT|nr:LacI family DNA-binding transcriptional regulator [Loktanella atrilutea]SHF56104.1 transcriptional regulator, LacI family [Loktanella atrilutea]
MRNDAKRTTIYDIAALAGASPSAVSAVLNGSWQKRRLSRSLADRVLRIAEQEGYAVNAQASLLRRERSHIIGMIVPKYDNRYFGHIAEEFEAMARDRNLFPVVTCTQRDPELEFEAAKELVSYQAECLISTGATDPDRISAFCKASGVQSINLDLPGTLAPSVISDNHAAARDLTHLIMDRCASDLGWAGPLRFVGGRREDHNTSARIAGFEAAHADRGIAIPEDHIMARGYSAQTARSLLDDFAPEGPTGLFVNSTISLEGVVQWHAGLGAARSRVRYGCFDFDPFGSFLPGNVGMVEQDVGKMLETAFALVGERAANMETIRVPCRLLPF